MPKKFQSIKTSSFYTHYFDFKRRFNALEFNILINILILSKSIVKRNSRIGQSFL